MRKSDFRELRIHRSHINGRRGSNKWLERKIAFWQKIERRILEEGNNMVEWRNVDACRR